MLYIGKKPEKPSVGKIVLTVTAVICGVAALAVAAYSLYRRFALTCNIDDDAVDFDLADDDCSACDEAIEVERDEGAEENDFEEQ